MKFIYGFLKYLLIVTILSAFMPVTVLAKDALIFCTSESRCGFLGQCRETFKIDEKRKELFRILEVGGQTAEIPLVNVKWSESVLFGEFRELGQSSDGVTGYMQFTFNRLKGEMSRYDSIYRNAAGEILKKDELIKLEEDRLNRSGPIFGAIRKSLIEFSCDKKAAKF